MSNHDQTQENLAAYLAAGLSAKERADVEQHLSDCAECATALADARKLEETIDDLFANARPDAELEERALAGVRKSRMRRASILRFVGAAAAVLVVGLVGSVVQVLAFADFRQRGSESPDVVVLFDDSGSMHGLAHHGINSEPLSLTEDKLMAEGYTPRKPNFPIVDVDGVSAASVNSTTVNGLGTGSMAPHKGAPRVQFAPVHVDPKMQWAEPNTTINGRSGATRDNAIRSGGGGASEAQATFAMMLKVSKGTPQWGGYSPPEKAESTFTTVGSKLGYAALGVSDNRKADDGKGYFKGSVALAPKPGDGPPAPPGDPRGGDQSPDGSKAASNKPSAQNVREDIAMLISPNMLLPPKVEKPKAPEPALPESKIIYTGEMEFEIDSFDAGIKKVKELVDAVNLKLKKGAPGASRPEIDRTKQPNGKTRGYIVIRIPPEFLDKFIDDLRAELSKFGELKSQHLGSQNVTKQYTDTKSELDAARLVEKRLIEIIEKKQGDIKDLVAAENVLGTWRSKIEKMEGEIRYYNNQVALSTLTITLVERDIGTPASLVVSEKVQMRIEVDEVKNALKTAVDLVRTYKGRVLKSELKQHKAGQFEAILEAEVPPDQKGDFAKKLAALGVVSENEATQKTQSVGGSGKPGNILPRVNDVVFEIKLNNIVNIQPRHAVTLDVAVNDVPAGYKEFKKGLEKIPKTQIRVDNLNEQDKLRVTAQLEFNVPTDSKDAIEKLIAEIKGKVLKKATTQAALTEIATNQKYGYTVSLLGPASIAPRETVTLKVEVKNVDKRIDELKAAVKLGNGRVADTNVVRQENGQVSAVMVLDVPLAVQDLIVEKVKESGNLLHQQATRNPNIPENELASARIEVTLSGVFAGKPPREKVNLHLEVADVDKTAAELKELVKAINGRIADGKVERKPNGQVSTELQFDVPLAVHDTLVKQIKDDRKEVSYKTETNASVPDNELATARITVKLDTPRPIGTSDTGVSFVRHSLDWSVWIFSNCILAIIAGLSAIVPVGIAIYVGYKVVWWLWPGSSAKPANGGTKPPA